MKAEEMALLINTTFSLVELLILLQKRNPDMDKEMAEKIAILKVKVNSLAEKPTDYLQNWDG
jgi:hypothetical protein